MTVSAYVYPHARYYATNGESRNLSFLATARPLNTDSLLNHFEVAPRPIAEPLPPGTSSEQSRSPTLTHPTSEAEYVVCHPRVVKRVKSKAPPSLRCSVPYRHTYGTNHVAAVAS